MGHKIQWCVIPVHFLSTSICFELIAHLKIITLWAYWQLGSVWTSRPCELFQTLFMQALILQAITPLHELGCGHARLGKLLFMCAIYILLYKYIINRSTIIILSSIKVSWSMDVSVHEALLVKLQGSSDYKAEIYTYWQRQVSAVVNFALLASSLK